MFRWDTMGEIHMLTESDLNKMAGKFIVVDGSDGCGKSTVVSRLEADLRGANVPVLRVREPGGTEYGEQIRNLLLHWKPETPEKILPLTEVLLFSAARAQLFHTKIVSALAEGICVLTDRFVSSTFAYQGSSGVDAWAIETISDVIIPRGEWPYITVVIDVSEEEALKRIAGRGSVVWDRIEDRSSEFHAEVRRRYREAGLDMPSYTKVVDGNGGPDEVYDVVCKAIQQRLGVL